MLVIDSGNALFGQALLGRSAADITTLVPDERIDLILSAMAKVQTVAMAAGQKDLLRGPKYLKDHAAKAGVPVLSANLFKDGALFFKPSLLTRVGGVTVGLIGLTAPESVADPAFTVQPPVKAALAQAKALRGKVDLLIVLGAIAYGDALTLAEDRGSGIHFVIQSHESRDKGSPQLGGGAWVLPSGERGRMVGQLLLDLNGKGAFQSKLEKDRLSAQHQGLEAKVAEVKVRLAKATDGEARKQLQATLEGFQARARDVASQLSGPKAPGRLFEQSFITLGPERSSDEVLKAKVEALEPPGSAGH